MKDKLDLFFSKYRKQDKLLVTDCVLDIVNIVREITDNKPISTFITIRSSRPIRNTVHMFFKELLKTIDEGTRIDISAYLSIIENDEKPVSKPVLMPNKPMPLNKEILELFRVLPLQEVINLIDILYKIKRDGG